MNDEILNKTFTVNGLAIALELKTLTVYRMINDGYLSTVTVNGVDKISYDDYSRLMGDKGTSIAEVKRLTKPYILENKTSQGTIIITEDFLLKNASGKAGWNLKQLAVVGIEWPPSKGWKKNLIGTRITNEQAELFSALRKVKK